VGDTMAEPLERNSLELRMAFHNAVSRFQDWTANVAEPKVRLLRLLLAAITFTLWTAMPCAHAAGVEQLEANKKAVAAFEDAALNQKDFDGPRNRRSFAASLPKARGGMC
jgi:hypothetical protein